MEDIDPGFIHLSPAVMERSDFDALERYAEPVEPRVIDSFDYAHQATVTAESAESFIRAVRGRLDSHDTTFDKVFDVMRSKRFRAGTVKQTRFDENRELFRLLLSGEMAKGVRPLPGALELAEELRGSVPIAVASNSPREILAGALEAAGLSDAFDVVIGVDEVSEAKPAPDLYLTASERLGAPPAESIAVEDSPAGVAAARAAGLYVIGIPSLAGVALEADMTADSLDDVAVRERLGVAEPAPRKRGR